MTSKEREILRMASKGISQRSIARALSCSRYQVATIQQKAEDLRLSWPLPDSLSDENLEELLHPATTIDHGYEPPDFNLIDKEMKKSGITLTLLWGEYCENCRSSGKKPFMYSQFCHHYRQHRMKSKATMHLDRQPGEQVEVDWAGQTAEIIDPDTGELITAYIFVASLSYSQYTYIEAFLKQDLDAWIQAHIHLFNFLNGVPKIIVSDNLKTGVSRTDWYSPQIQRNYQELAEHYDTVVLPARIRAPKDKPNVEGNVGHITSGILAKIRHIQCFSLTELNNLLWEHLKTMNHRPFQKKDGSRASWYMEEKEFLLPLPKTPYELSIWHEATVQFNYHIALYHMYYSVPYEYIKQKVQVKVTPQVVEIYCQSVRIATHHRLFGRKGQYSTVPSHMPPDHQVYLNWDEKRFLDWSKKIGPATQQVVQGILASAKIKQQAYKSCMGLIKLADRNTSLCLEMACQKALEFSAHPSYKTVHSIIKSGAGDRKSAEDEAAQDKNPHAFTRGAKYYGGDK